MWRWYAGEAGEPLSAHAAFNSVWDREWRRAPDPSSGRKLCCCVTRYSIRRSSECCRVVRQLCPAEWPKGTLLMGHERARSSVSGQTNLVTTNEPGPFSHSPADPNGVVLTAQGEALGKRSPCIRGEPVRLVHVASHNSATCAERGHGMNGSFRTDPRGVISSQAFDLRCVWRPSWILLRLR